MYLRIKNLLVRKGRNEGKVCLSRRCKNIRAYLTSLVQIIFFHPSYLFLIILFQWNWQELSDDGFPCGDCSVLTCWMLNFIEYRWFRIKTPTQFYHLPSIVRSVTIRDEERGYLEGISSLMILFLYSADTRSCAIIKLSSEENNARVSFTITFQCVDIIIIMRIPTREYNSKNLPRERTFKN